MPSGLPLLSNVPGLTKKKKLFPYKNLFFYLFPCDKVWHVWYQNDQLGLLIPKMPSFCAYDVPYGSYGRLKVYTFQVLGKNIFPNPSKLPPNCNSNVNNAKQCKTMPG